MTTDGRPAAIEPGGTKPLAGRRIILGSWWAAVRKRVSLALAVLSTAGIVGVYAAATTSSAVAQPAAPSLTADDIAKLKPEICKASWSRAITGALPFLVGSSTTDMTPEQIALVDEYKPESRHKVWVIRLPAAFINYRTCDLGRDNWVGEGDYVKVSQQDRLAILILGEQVVPASRARAYPVGVESGFPKVRR